MHLRVQDELISHYKDASDAAEKERTLRALAYADSTDMLPFAKAGVVRPARHLSMHLSKKSAARMSTHIETECAQRISTQPSESPGASAGAIARRAHICAIHRAPQREPGAHGVGVHHRKSWRV